MVKVTYARLFKVLRQLGFSSQTSKGDHLVYLHKPTGALLVLPRGRRTDTVPAASLAAIRMSIIGQNAATQLQVDELLQGGRLQTA
jgi:predicted RNA binding protein YcfA (HicA-like mRNA interferase family)